MRSRYFLGALVFVSASACSEAPPEGACEKLHAHLISLELADQGESSNAELKSKLVEKTEKDFVARCNKDLRDVQVQCSLKATSRTQLDACDEK